MCLLVCVLQTGLRTLPPTLGSLFGAGGFDLEAAVRDLAKQCSSDLKQRAAQELPLLPYSRCAHRQPASTAGCVCFNFPSPSATEQSALLVSTC